MVFERLPVPCVTLSGENRIAVFGVELSCLHESVSRRRAGSMKDQRKTLVAPIVAPLLGFALAEQNFDYENILSEGFFRSG